MRKNKTVVVKKINKNRKNHEKSAKLGKPLGKEWESGAKTKMMQERAYLCAKTKNFVEIETEQKRFFMRKNKTVVVKKINKNRKNR